MPSGPCDLEVLICESWSYVCVCACICDLNIIVSTPERIHARIHVCIYE